MKSRSARDTVKENLLLAEVLMQLKKYYSTDETKKIFFQRFDK